MLAPSSEKKTATKRVQTFVVSALSPVRMVLAFVKRSYLNYVEARKRRHEYRTKVKLQQRASWRRSICETFFMLVDYDPTHAESGETQMPSISGAISQWFVRVIWTRRIELGGFLFILVVGLICYQAITSS